MGEKIIPPGILEARIAEANMPAPEASHPATFLDTRKANHGGYITDKLRGLWELNQESPHKAEKLTIAAATLIVEHLIECTALPADDQETHTETIIGIISEAKDPDHARTTIVAMFLETNE